MSKKDNAAKNETATNDFNGDSFADDVKEMEENNQSASLSDMPDFDVDEEYKPVPLIPPRTYRGHITEVAVDLKKSAVVFKITLQGNGGFLTDGTTPIDGATEQYFVWLPKKDDAKEMTASGRQTKHQWKINQMADFAKGMKISMKNINTIATAVAESHWIGIPVKVEVDLDTYKGQVRNRIQQMVRDTEAEADLEDSGF